MGIGNSTELLSLQRKHDKEKRTLPTAALAVHTVLNDLNAQEVERALQLLTASSSSRAVDIDLSNCGITDEGVRSNGRAIQAAFQKSRKGREKDEQEGKMSSQRRRGESAHATTTRSASVRTLNLSYNQLTDVSVVFLLEKGASCGMWDRLRSLTLSGNRIRSKSCAAIASHLLLPQREGAAADPTNASALLSLVLFNCDLRDDDVKPIFDALQRGATSLRELNVAMNPRLTSRTLLMCLKAIDVDYADFVEMDEDEEQTERWMDGREEKSESDTHHHKEHSESFLKPPAAYVNDTLAVFRCDVGEAAVDESGKNGVEKEDASAAAMMMMGSGAAAGAASARWKKHGTRSATKEVSSASTTLSLRSRIDSILETRLASWQAEKERIRIEERDAEEEEKEKGATAGGGQLRSLTTLGGSSRHPLGSGSSGSRGRSARNEEEIGSGAAGEEEEAYRGLPTSASHVVRHLYATGTYGSNTLHPLNPANEKKSAGPSADVDAILTVEALEMFVDPLLPQEESKRSGNASAVHAEHPQHQQQQQGSRDGSFLHSINTRNNSNSNVVLPSIVGNMKRATARNASLSSSSSSVKRKEGMNNRMVHTHHPNNTSSASASKMFSWRHRSVSETENEARRWRDARAEKGALTRTTYNGFTPFHLDVTSSSSSASSVKSKSAGGPVDSTVMRTLAASSRPEAYYVEAPRALAPCWCVNCSGETRRTPAQSGTPTTTTGGVPTGYKGIDMDGGLLHYHCRYEEQRYRLNRGEAVQAAAAAVSHTRVGTSSSSRGVVGVGTVKGGGAAGTSNEDENNATLKKKYTQGCCGTGHRCVSSHLSPSTLPDHSAAHFFSSPAVSTARGLQFM